ncbi:hypothetical protein TanjilG_00578 [Lupinus angustifolius]|uniref:Uncharacterized protein n=1 Tax=Lupinus angustifolius TaxID=3871 RepID=A0A394DHQ7_LUPAN|nr:hypothetical protein TanjilG_00578 [Lupinus angustifolius]
MDFIEEDDVELEPPSSRPMYLAVSSEVGIDGIGFDDMSKYFKSLVNLGAPPFPKICLHVLILMLAIHQDEFRTILLISTTFLKQLETMNQLLLEGSVNIILSFLDNGDEFRDCEIDRISDFCMDGRLLLWLVWMVLLLLIITRKWRCFLYPKFIRLLVDSVKKRFLQLDIE